MDVTGRLIDCAAEYFSFKPSAIEISMFTIGSLKAFWSFVKALGPFQIYLYMCYLPLKNIRLESGHYR